jgi:hypothetical protein
MAGTQYWLIASAIASDTQIAWPHNSVGASGPQAISTDGGPFIVATAALGAFDVIGTTVPEPGTFALAAAGLALCIARCWDPQ